jgi:hypothetical protein
MAKWARGMAQAVECLLYKCEALNSNPNPTKNRGAVSSSVKRGNTIKINL